MTNNVNNGRTMLGEIEIFDYLQKDNSTKEHKSDELTCGSMWLSKYLGMSNYQMANEDKKPFIGPHDMHLFSIQNHQGIFFYRLGDIIGIYLS